MRRPFLATGVLAATGALLLATASPAMATEITSSQDQSGGSAGAGTITADSTADLDTGALTATASAVGGGDGGEANPIFGFLCSFPGGLLSLLFPDLAGPSGPSTARGAVFLSGGEDLQAGQYQVTVTFTGAQTTESTQGSGVANGLVSSRATFSTGGENFSVVGSRSQDLSADPETIVLQYDIAIPTAGAVGVTATLASEASAKGEGNSAAVDSAVTSTTIEIAPR